MKRPLDQLAEIAQKATAIGNDLIKKRRPQTVTEKADRDTYTDVDVRIEQEIRTYLGEATPEIGFNGEEEGRFSYGFEGELTWVLDPIDGTANFVHGIPLCATQLALMENDEAIVAAISLPFFDLHYTASKGDGAYANGRRIKSSASKRLDQSIVSIGDYAVGQDATKKNAKRIAITATLAGQVERIRMFGSAAHDLAWVAEGRSDAAVILSNNVIDIAPGALIASEAGAKLVDTKGNPYSSKSKSIIAAAPGITDLIIELLDTRPSRADQA